MTIARVDGVIVSTVCHPSMAGHRTIICQPLDEQGRFYVAETFRINPELDVETVITELKVGEALVSLLQPDGAPTPVQRTLIKPPSSRVARWTARRAA